MMFDIAHEGRTQAKTTDSVNISLKISLWNVFRTRRWSSGRLLLDLDQTTSLADGGNEFQDKKTESWPITFLFLCVHNKEMRSKNHSQKGSALCVGSIWDRIFCWNDPHGPSAWVNFWRRRMGVSLMNFNTTMGKFLSNSTVSPEYLAEPLRNLQSVVVSMKTTERYSDGYLFSFLQYFLFAAVSLSGARLLLGLVYQISRILLRLLNLKTWSKITLSQGESNLVIVQIDSDLWKPTGWSACPSKCKFVCVFWFHLQQFTVEVRVQQIKQIPYQIRKFFRAFVVLPPDIAKRFSYNTRDATKARIDKLKPIENAITIEVNSVFVRHLRRHDHRVTIVGESSSVTITPIAKLLVVKIFYIVQASKGTIATAKIITKPSISAKRRPAVWAEPKVTSIQAFALWQERAKNRHWQQR